MIWWTVGPLTVATILAVVFMLLHHYYRVLLTLAAMAVFVAIHGMSKQGPVSSYTYLLVVGAVTAGVAGWKLQDGKK